MRKAALPPKETHSTKKSYNRRGLLSQIEHMHDEMHEIELKLDMPSRFYFQWGG